MRKELGAKFYTCLLAFAVGMALLLGISTNYFSGAGSEDPPSYVRSVGVPSSPWLVVECRDIQITGEINCGNWAPSLEAESWSWLMLLIAVAAGIIAQKIAGKSGAEISQEKPPSR